MPAMGGWVTIVSGKYLDEVLRAPEATLSFHEKLNDILQLEHLIGPQMSQDQIHLPLIKILNRNIDLVHAEIADETPFAIELELSKAAMTDGWTEVKCFETAYNCVLRLNLRAFMGLPLCRDDEWMKAINKDGLDFALRTVILRMFPKARRGSANMYPSKFGIPFRAATKSLAEVIQQRLSIPEEERPNNLLTWILSRLPGEEPDVHLINGIFQIINMVSLNNTAMTLGHALFYLVANPECIDIIREEIHDSLEGGDITRDSLNQMHKLDSFIRESLRHAGLSNLSILRVALKDFVFSDGTRVSAGESIQAIAKPIHLDSNYYDDPNEFKPWRFYDMAHAEVDEGSAQLTDKYDLVEPSNEFLIWGLGKHTCPGRWYAAMEIKHLMAYMILNYDIKLPDSAKGKRPANLHVLGVCLPNRSAKILFKRRENSE